MTSERQEYTHLSRRVACVLCNTQKGKLYVGCCHIVPLLLLLLLLLCHVLRNCRSSLLLVIPLIYAAYTVAKKIVDNDNDNDFIKCYSPQAK